MEAEIKDDETRMKVLIVPQKTTKKSPEKIFVLAIADHSEFDEKNLLQCFSLLQDDPKARSQNRVPGLIRQSLTTQEISDRFEDYLELVLP